MSVRCLLFSRRHPKDITKTSYEYLLDILQEYLLDVFWIPEDGRHFKTCRRHLLNVFSISSGYKKTWRRHLLFFRRHPKDIAKTSYEYLLDILQEDLLDVFWIPEDGRHFKTCRRHLLNVFSISSGFKKTSRRHSKDSQKIRRRYIQYVFWMHSAQLLHRTIRIRAVDRMTTRDRMTKIMQQKDKKCACKISNTYTTN